MKSRLITVSSVVCVILLGLTGCLGQSAKQTTIEGGVYKSINNAETWDRKNAVLTAGGTRSIEGVNTKTITFDPQDPETLYLGTYANGLFYTIDGGNSWSATVLDDEQINDIAVSPAAKCFITVATGNVLKRSNDCARTFSDVFIDTKKTTQTNSVAINRLNPAQIFIGTNAGSFLVSNDFGDSWELVRTFDDSIEKILLDDKTPNRIYVFMRSKGIYLSDDSGLNWKSLDRGLSNYNGANVYRDVYIDSNEPNTLIYASKYGLLKTNDAGTTWQPIETIVGSSVNIYAIGVNSINNKELFFISNDRLYHTKDGGQTWIPRNLPSKRTGVRLLVHPNTPSIVYLGVAKLK